MYRFAYKISQYFQALTVRSSGLNISHSETRQRLHSSSSSSLIVSRTRLSTVGDRAFPVAAARIWNSLPDLVTSAPSVAVFRSWLKTHLFNISYPSLCDCTVVLSCFGHYNRSSLLTLCRHIVKFYIVTAVIIG